MDVSKLKRDAKKIHSTILETEDNKLITKSGCYILFPEGYINKGLAVIGSEVSCLAVFAIVVGDTYGVSTATTMCHLGDGRVETVSIGDVKYIKVSYGPGDVFMKNTNLIVQNKLQNSVMGFFMDLGKAPFFFTYLDMADLFIDVGVWNNMHLGDLQAVRDILGAIISRKFRDVKAGYRNDIKLADLNTRPNFIPLNDVALNATSNLARLNGSHLKLATRAALLNTSTEASDLEKLYNE